MATCGGDRAAGGALCAGGGRELCSCRDVAIPRTKRFGRCRDRFGPRTSAARPSSSATPRRGAVARPPRGVRLARALTGATRQRRAIPGQTSATMPLLARESRRPPLHGIDPRVRSRARGEFVQTRRLLDPVRSDRRPLRKVHSIEVADADPVASPGAGGRDPEAPATSRLCEDPDSDDRRSICYDLAPRASYRGPDATTEPRVLRCRRPSISDREAHWEVLDGRAAIENQCYCWTRTQTGEHTATETTAITGLFDPWGRRPRPGRRRRWHRLAELDGGYWRKSATSSRSRARALGVRPDATLQTRRRS